MNNFEDIVLPLCILNVPGNKDSPIDCLKQFENKPEFQINLISDFNTTSTELQKSIWNAIQRCIKNAILNDDDILLIAKTDHIFTANYSRDFLFRNVVIAQRLGCDILLSGIGDFRHAFPILEHLYWVDSFNHASFFVIYRKFFKPIVESEFVEKNDSFEVLSELTSHKVMLYPFISEYRLSSKEYYKASILATSDDMREKFARSNNRFHLFQRVYQKYLSKNKPFIKCP